MEDKPTPVKFLADSHIAKAVTVQLRERGVDIVRCQEVGLADADDPVLVEYALQEGRIIVSHDADFTRHDKEWREAGRRHAGILIVTSRFQGNIGAIVKELLEIHEFVEGGAATVEEDFADRVIFI